MTCCAKNVVQSDQQKHNIGIKNILYSVSTATCFDTSASPSNSLTHQTIKQTTATCCNY